METPPRTAAGALPNWFGRATDSNEVRIVFPKADSGVVERLPDPAGQRSGRRNPFRGTKRKKSARLERRSEEGLSARKPVGRTQSDVESRFAIWDIIQN